MKKIEGQKPLHQLAKAVEIETLMYNKIKRSNRSPKHTQEGSLQNFYRPIK
jgi:hypothetical protein